MRVIHYCQVYEHHYNTFKSNDFQRLFVVFNAILNICIGLAAIIVVDKNKKLPQLSYQIIHKFLWRVKKGPFYQSLHRAPHLVGRSCFIYSLPIHFINQIKLKFGWTYWIFLNLQKIKHVFLFFLKSYSIFFFFFKIKLQNYFKCF